MILLNEARKRVRVPAMFALEELVRGHGTGSGTDLTSVAAMQRLLVKETYAADPRREVVEAYRRASQQVARVRCLDDKASASKVRFERLSTTLLAC